MKFDPRTFSEKVFNGKRDGQRRCRFCGRVLDESHFKKEAHAISISLGNTKFICADECDECNEQFGQNLENDVTIFFQVFLSMYQVPKRNGKERQVNGRNFEMQMTDDINPITELPTLRFHMHDWKDDNADTSDVMKMMNELDLSNKTFVPQNIYKAICKYALSLMPHTTTLHYQKTIKWIQGSFYEDTLPKMKIASYDRDGNEPIMTLFLRKTPNTQYPLCVAYLCVANVHFFYPIPFCDESKSVEEDNAKFDAFWGQLNRSNPLNSLGYEDSELSNPNRIGFKFDMDLKMEDGATPIKLKKNESTGGWVVDKSTQ